MAGKRVGIQVSPELARWVVAVPNTSGMQASVRREFEAANDVFYDKTQQFVHIDTGDLKSSGERSYEESRGEVRAYLEYTEEYAIFEERRGGSHAYMSRGWRATEELFERALSEAFEDIARKWGL